MCKVGLIILGIIQIFTAISVLTTTTEKETFGLRMLIKEQSIFRYLLTSLWLTVSIIYFIGAFNWEYFKAASLMAIVNIILEIISYWVGFIKNRKLKVYAPLATLVMCIPLILIIVGSL